MIFCLRRNLCGLTYVLYLTLDRDSAFADARQGLVDKFCTVFPLVLLVLAYIFDSNDNMDPSKVNPNPNPNLNPNSYPNLKPDSKLTPTLTLTLTSALTLALTLPNPNPNASPNPTQPNPNSYPNPNPNLTLTLTHPNSHPGERTSQRRSTLM